MEAKHLGARRPRCAAVGAAALALALAATMAWQSPHASAASMESSSGLSTNYDFVRLVLADGGWPASSNNVTVLAQWLRAEEPPSHWWDRDNPLNNGLGSGGGSGLGSYDSLVVAAYDVARNLEVRGWGYPAIARDLAASAAPGVTARAIWRSNWAAGHYGFGADWDTTPVPSVPAPPTSWRDVRTCDAPSAADAVGPCDAAFQARGGSWRWLALGAAGEELWTPAGRPSHGAVATWAPNLAAGSYEVSAFVPAAFADALAAYVVVDANGGHRVVVNEEPYDDAWVPLGRFDADSTSSIRVVLRAGGSGSAPSTYLAAAAMRFAPIVNSRAKGTGAVRAQRTPEPPGAPLHVTAVASSSGAVVSWLAPSKDGGRTLLGFVAEAIPGGATCQARANAAPLSCTISGLHNGAGYRFVVRARNSVGEGRPSVPSTPVRPVQATTLVLTTAGTLQLQSVVVLHATISPPPSGGLVLFALDGQVLPGCQSARVHKGHAACATRLKATGSHEVLANYSGSTSSAGSEALATVHVKRTTTHVQAAASPGVTAPLDLVTLRAWGLPGAARGDLVFSSGGSRLCATGVLGGGGSCVFRVHLAPGSHQVIATYRGSRDDAASSAQTTLVVLSPPAGAS